MKDKVFGIGFHKTATASLGSALELLGYNLGGKFPIDGPILHDSLALRAIEYAKDYEVFKDNPWPPLFKDLDRAFPGSKFILTIRDPDEWLRSVVRHFGRNSTPLREFIYGVGFPEGNEQIYLERYETHNRRVLEYFQGRRGDLLVMNIFDGDGWEKICSFLGMDLPRMKFPHRNKAGSREIKRIRRRVKTFIENII
jgi:hypothetical protein